MRIALLAAALLAAAPAWAAASFEARVRVFQPACSQVQREDVTDALKQASRLLSRRCRIRLRLVDWVTLPIRDGLCQLPGEPGARRQALDRRAAALKRADPSALALFLLPTDEDSRISWSLVDRSRASACDSPQEARFLARFGSIFFTDLSWGSKPAVGGYARPALLLAHEALHSLTQRGHPSGAPRGAVMADHVADIGTGIDPDWCACAAQSPYLKALP